jgi:alpha-galactosidase
MNRHEADAHLGPAPHAASIGRTSVRDRPAWLVQTAEGAVLLSLSPADALLVEHWGAPLARGEAFGTLAAMQSNRAAQADFWDGLPVAYTSYGDPTFKEPCLAVAYSDGVRNVSLEFDYDDITKSDRRTILTLAFVDRTYGLRVEHRFSVFEGQDVVVRSARITNVSEYPIQLERALTGSWGLPPSEYELWTMQGHGWGDEFNIVRRPLQPGGKVEVGSRNGYTSREANPWFALGVNRELTEHWGQVWFGALAWSGNWIISVETERNDSVHVVAGINPFDFSWHLSPGEAFETPELVSGYTEGGVGSASQILHRYASEQVLPQTHRDTIRPVHYNSWFTTMFDVQVEHQILLARRAAALGADLFVVDDGWFGARDSEHAGLGDWVSSKSKFPNGLSELIDPIHEMGMKFGIWVEPEMVSPDSDLFRSHPDWVYHFPGRPAMLARHQLVLNFARSDVRNAICSQLRQLLREHRIDCLKWDHNRPYTNAGWPEAPVARQREIWVRHVRGLYEVVATLREEFPDVLFETCAGGGGRADLGILALMDQSWVSDNTDPADRLRIQHNYSRAYPPSTMVGWVTDNPNHETGRQPSLAFRFHVAMQGVLGVSADLLKWTAEEFAEAQELIRDYKRVQDVIQFGAQYWPKAPDQRGTAAVQYVSRDAQRFVLFLYQVEGAVGIGHQQVRLRGLPLGQVYRRVCDGAKVSSRDLMAKGVPMFPPPQAVEDWRSEMQIWEGAE